MSKDKKSKKSAGNGALADAGKFAGRNARTIGAAGAGLVAGAAAVLLGQRYARRGRSDDWSDDEIIGGAGSL